MQDEKNGYSASDNGRACGTPKADGTPCGAKVMNGGKFCFFHDPETTQERKAAQSRGGKRRRAPVLPADAADIVLDNQDDVDKFLIVTMNDVRKGRLGTDEARTLCSLLGIRQRIRASRDIEKRLAAIEAVLKTRPPKGGLFDPNGSDGGSR
jgi:hypothetical protein